MTTLAELRQLVRQQTETTEAELPNVTIDDYLAQAFERTVNAEIQWPFYETTWSLTQGIGDSFLTMPADAGGPGIMSLYDVDRDARLIQIAPEEAEDRFYGRTVSFTKPINYSLWSNKIQLWPQVTFTVERTYTLRGFRKPTPFPVTGGLTTQEPDCDSRLHKCLAHYATALAYIQQEDMELENQYMRRWQADVEMARGVIMEPSHHRPMVMGPSGVYSTPIGATGGKRGYPIAYRVATP